MTVPDGPPPTERLNRWNLINVAVSVIGIVVAGVAVPLFIAYRNQPKEPARPITAEQRLAVCDRRHHAPATEQHVSGAVISAHYLRCAWPPTEGAARDGFYEVNRMTYTIPDASMAQQFTQYSLFDARCRVLRLQYRFANQGSTKMDPPLDLYVDQVVSMYDGTLVNPYEITSAADLSPLTDTHGKLVVFEHGRYSLAHVECIAN